MRAVEDPGELDPALLPQFTRLRRSGRDGTRPVRRVVDVCCCQAVGRAEIHDSVVAGDPNKAVAGCGQRTGRTASAAAAVVECRSPASDEVVHSCG
jgi:hypothetical protein